MESLFSRPSYLFRYSCKAPVESADRHVKVTNWCAPPSLRSYLVCHERCVQHSIKTNPQFSLNVNYLEGMLNAFPNRNRVNSVPTRRIFSRCGKCLFWVNNEINLKYLQIDFIKKNNSLTRKFGLISNLLAQSIELFVVFGNQNMESASEIKTATTKSEKFLKALSILITWGQDFIAFYAK